MRGSGPKGVNVTAVGLDIRLLCYMLCFQGGWGGGGKKPGVDTGFEVGGRGQKLRPHEERVGVNLTHVGEFLDVVIVAGNRCAVRNNRRPF